MKTKNSAIDGHDGTPTGRSLNARADHTLRDNAPTHKLHRAAGFRPHGHHVVDPPPAAAVETRQGPHEASRLGDINADLELPGPLARADRTPAESKDGILDHGPPNYAP